jgi:hypothetical protein
MSLRKLTLPICVFLTSTLLWAAGTGSAPSGSNVFQACWNTLGPSVTLPNGVVYATGTTGAGGTSLVRMLSSRVIVSTNASYTALYDGTAFGASGSTGSYTPGKTMYPLCLCAQATTSGPIAAQFGYATSGVISDGTTTLPTGAHFQTGGTIGTSANLGPFVFSLAAENVPACVPAIGVSVSAAQTTGGPIFIQLGDGSFPGGIIFTALVIDN